MHLKCVSLTIVHNLVHFLLIFSLVFQTSKTQQKESIPEFENFPIIDSELDRNEEDFKQRSDAWIQHTSSSSITVGNVATFARVLPKFSSADEVVDHVINSGVIENLETEELEKISKKYNEFNENNDNESNENTNKNNDYESQEFRSHSRDHRNRLMKSKQLLRHLLEVYKLKSSGILAKRGEGPQLSIVNPLDVLRQRLLLELARRRMKENQDQIQANAEILRKIGKRSIVAIGTIPQKSIRYSGQEFNSTNKTTDRRSYRFLKANNNKKSCIKCQKDRRKSGANRLFLDN